MKKYLLLVLICLTSLGVMAQHPSNQRPPQGPPPSAQHDHHHDGHHDSHHHDHHHDAHHDSHHHHPTPPPPAPVVTATAEQLQLALQVLDKQSYDDKRMEVAKLCVVLCPFTVRDLGRMAGRFTMEDRKVDFLIFAHKYCPDRENYYLLRDVLRYRSDYDKLMEAVDPNYRRR